MKRTQLSSEELKALRAVPVNRACPNRLRVAMALVDVTQNDVAAGTNLTQATISGIYNFRGTDAKLSTLQALSRFFGCAIEDLFPPLEHGDTAADQPALPFRKKAVNA